MPFLTTPLVRPDGRRWQLAEPLVYETTGARFQVPAGFVSDGASSPRPLWWLVAPWGRHQWAAVLHDWLYSRCCPLAMRRPEADAHFRRALADCGVSRWKRLLMWAAVRLFGAHRWR